MMLYCENCQVLSRDGKTCPMCGTDQLRPVRAEDPVLLVTVGQEDAERASAAFQDAAIPCLVRAMGVGSALTVFTGKSHCEENQIFVPYEEVEHAREVLVGIGILKEEAEPAPAAEKPEESAPMSREKRTVVRIVSAAAFFLLVWLAVSLSDTLADFIKSLFR